MTEKKNINIENIKEIIYNINDKGVFTESDNLNDKLLVTFPLQKTGFFVQMKSGKDSVSLDSILIGNELFRRNYNEGNDIDSKSREILCEIYTLCLKAYNAGKQYK